MKIILWVIQLILFSISLLLGYGLYDNQFLIYISLMIFLISFVIVNSDEKNIININSFFLLGFGLFILGRFLGYLIAFNSIDISLDQMYCFDFFVSYCASYEEQIKLVNFINVTLIAFTFPFVFYKKISNVQQESNRKILSNIKNLAPIVCMLGIYLLYLSFSQILLAIQQGYMVLFAGQAESYQTPIQLILYSFFIAYIALLFSYLNFDNSVIIRKYFSILVFMLLVMLISSIGTGGRTGFITGILFFIWLKYRDMKMNILKYMFFCIFCILLINFIDIVAALSGARPIEVETDFINQVANVFYSQGGTLMIMNSALNLEDPPTLGYLKTIIPGIQVFFSFFDVTERYEFDWSSYLAYKNNSDLYYDGFGLGWSLFADLYLLANKFILLYLVFVALWGWILKKLSLGYSAYSKGLLFIFILYIFSISRASISPLIFVFFIYTFLFFLFSYRKRAD